MLNGEQMYKSLQSFGMDGVKRINQEYLSQFAQIFTMNWTHFQSSGQISEKSMNIYLNSKQDLSVLPSDSLIHTFSRVSLYLLAGHLKHSLFRLL